MSEKEKGATHPSESLAFIGLLRYMSVIPPHNTAAAKTQSALPVLQHVIYLPFLSFFQVCGLGRKLLPHTRKLLWCVFQPHGSSRTVTSPYCVTWRSWAVVWSTALRPSSTVSISSGPSRSSLGMECLCQTRTPTVRDHLYVC